MLPFRSAGKMTETIYAEAIGRIRIDKTICYFALLSFYLDAKAVDFSLLIKLFSSP